MQSEAITLAGMAMGALVLILGTIVLIVVIWQGMITARSRASVAREEAYRTLAERATAAQEQTAADQEKIAEGMADLRVRVASIEKLLREVG